MTAATLGFISETLRENNIPYCFQRWTGEITYPYFVGEYTESGCINEDGESESTFILTGTADSTWISLEKAKEKLRHIFDDEGTTVIFPDGTAAAVMYSGAFQVPAETEEIKRIQVNFKIKEWRVN
ncbi:MAG: hypothetical protein ACI4JB_10300 [Porcipelethomonas sp.]